MRLFAAILFPTEVVAELAQLQRTIEQRVIKARMVSPANLHLTLQFLGEVTPDKLPSIKSSLKKAGEASVPFSLRWEQRLGHFGPLHPMRVLWLGLQEEQSGLRQLQIEVARKLTAVGFPPEQKRYEPHVTVARDIFWREPENWSISVPSIPSFKVNEFVLMESRIERGRAPAYEKMDSFSLGGNR
ncbi:RNA 2',3'-cyclic phosphodiesterase [Heliobacterium chlorum]|uniref:RNA 2',3'-cyclic phosphodiesterase n=1 Tax=Heliobacterium chlorum TaxID=2698 RepID=A0ABR7T204_HELCL|nr:RNA 2',3'-cyclic phosphodiesterase [Heliobacterium chlorum]MBC9784817.1 RNA 2',3'-cyclic phosphodiesterase [Heliobacterium chlorum]